MVIDDSYTDRYIASYIIRKNNFASEIISQESAGNALKYLKELSVTPKDLPQLIFLDIHMPGIDGFGFLDEYDKLPDSVKSNCNIIVLSAWFSPDEKERAKKSIYVSRFLSKPLEKEHLEELSPSELDKNASTQ